MSQAALRLVSNESANGDALPFERRQTRRHVMSGRVTSLQKTGTSSYNNRIGSLQLLDISEAGLGAIVPEPIEPGSSIVIFFPPHGPEGGFDRSGLVVRCKQTPHGHEIGIRFVSKSAA